MIALINIVLQLVPIVKSVTKQNVKKYVLITTTLPQSSLDNEIRKDFNGVWVIFILKRFKEFVSIICSWSQGVIVAGYK